MKNNKTSKQNIDLKKISITVFFSLIVFVISAYFVSIKQNFHIDELCSYGLANNQFQMLVDDYKIYTGEQLVKDYLAVHEGNQFDFANLFYNQAHDTHPILWYSVLHVICSIFVGNFSKWYGLIINCIFMIFVYWLMRHLLLIITKDKTISTIVPIMSMFLNAFINAITFTRMYIMLQAISLAFVCLIIDKILDIRNKGLVANVDNQQDKTNIIYKERFYLLFILYTIFGALTQYHYIVIAFIISLIFGLFLLKYKEYKVLIKSIASGIIGLLVSYAIFPAMINQIFTNTNSLHSLSNGKRSIDILDNLLGFFSLWRNAFFGNQIVFITIIAIIFVLIVLSIFRLNKKSNNSIISAIIDNDNILVLIILTIVSIAYYIIISSTATLIFSRYLFNIYPIVAIVLFGAIYLLLYHLNNKTRFISLLFILICIIFSNMKLPTHLYYEQKEMIEFMQEHKDIKTIMTYYDAKDSTNIWKLPYPLYDIKDMEQVVFVNTNNNSWEDNEALKDNKNLFVYVYTDTISNKQDDNDIIGKLARVNNLENSLAIYKTSYVHLYMLY